MKIRIAKVSGDDCRDGIIVDSGPSQHISKHLSNFSSVKEMEPVSLHLADDRSVTTKQQGSVLLRLFVHHAGTMRITCFLVTNILYIRQAAVNVLFCSQLNKARISSRIDNGTCLLLDRHDQARMIGDTPYTVRGGLYTLDTKVQHDDKSNDVATARVMMDENGVELWHRRLGHVDKDTIRNMAGKHVQGMVLN